jgi:hypothetical protein
MCVFFVCIIFEITSTIYTRVYLFGEIKKVCTWGINPVVHTYQLKANANKDF